VAELPDNDRTSEERDDVEAPSLPPGAPSRQPPPEEVLPRRSSDERDVGWGDANPEYDDEWYLNERPPHHG
jgi:hypothetical protein